jgi:hypothetical protein
MFVLTVDRHTHDGIARHSNRLWWHARGDRRLGEPIDRGAPACIIEWDERDHRTGRDAVRADERAPEPIGRRPSIEPARLDDLVTEPSAGRHVGKPSGLEGSLDVDRLCQLGKPWIVEVTTLPAQEDRFVGPEDLEEMAVGPSDRRMLREPSKHAVVTAVVGMPRAPENDWEHRCEGREEPA